MNSTATTAGPRDAFNWRDDLSAARDLSRNEVQAFGFVVGWFEDWRVRMKLPPGRESAREFWKVAVQSKPRQDWQLSQWAVVDHRRVTTHAFRQNAFATHFLEGGADIRTLQELLGHADVKTTEIYAHVAKIGNDKGVRSPLDALRGGRALDLDLEAVRQGDGNREDDGCVEEDEDWDED